MARFKNSRDRETFLLAKANAVAGRPSTDLATQLATYAPDRLQDLVDALDMPYCRPDPASQAAAVVDWVAQDNNRCAFAIAVLAGLSAPALDLAREAAEKGGAASFSPGDEEQVSWLAEAPLLGFCCYYEERLTRFTFALPDPVVQAVSGGTPRTNATFAEILSPGFLDRTNRILMRYGFLDPMELAELYAASCASDLDENLLGAYYLVATWMPGTAIYGIGFQGADDDREYDAQICDVFRDILGDFDGLETVRAQMARIDSARRLLDPAPVGDVLDPAYASFMDWYEAQPEQAAFLAWLGSHTPRGENAPFFKHDVLADVFECAQAPVGPHFLEPLFNGYLGLFEPRHREAFVAYARRCANATPRWDMYGHAPAELTPELSGPAVPPEGSGVSGDSGASGASGADEPSSSGLKLV